MPARNLPTPQDTATARRILLGGLAQGTEVAELAGELAPLHPRNNIFPGEVFLHVAADVLDWCGASRADPLALEGMRERFLPGCAFRGRQNKKLQFAILAAAALRGGAEPDLLDEVAWWQTDDFWQYGLFAAVGYIRAAARRAGVPGMPGPGRAPWPPSAITTSSGGCGSGHLTAGRPIITAAIVRHVCSGGHTGHGAARRWRGIAGLADALPAAASCWYSRSRDRTWAAWTLAGHRLCLGAAETDRAVRWHE